MRDLKSTCMLVRKGGEVLKGEEKNEDTNCRERETRGVRKTHSSSELAMIRTMVTESVSKTIGNGGEEGEKELDEIL